MKANKEYQKDYRERQAKRGSKPYTMYLTDTEATALKTQLKQLRDPFSTSYGYPTLTQKEGQPRAYHADCYNPQHRCFDVHLYLARGDFPAHLNTETTWAWWDGKKWITRND